MSDTHDQSQPTDEQPREPGAPSGEAADQTVLGGPGPHTPPRWGGWRTIGAEVFPYNAPIGAAISTPGEVDFFAVAPDGRIVTNHWRESFRTWDQIADGVAQPASPVTALTRDAGVVDLLVVGTDGRIYSTWWDGDWRPWMPVRGGAAPVGARVDAIAPLAGRISAHVVGNDGRVYTNLWRHRWGEWERLGHTIAPAGTPVSGAYNGQLRLFAVGQDGRVYATTQLASGWSAWAPLGPMRAPQKAPITATVSRLGEVELFMVGNDGLMGGDEGRVSTLRIGDPPVWGPIGSPTAPHGNTVAAAWIDPDRLVLAVVAKDGQVYAAQRLAGAGWSGWDLVPGLRVPATAPLTAIKVEGEWRIVLAVVGADGRVYANDFGV